MKYSRSDRVVVNGVTVERIIWDDADETRADFFCDHHIYCQAWSGSLPRCEPRIEFTSEVLSVKMATDAVAAIQAAIQWLQEAA